MVVELIGDQVIIGHHTTRGWTYDKVISKTLDAGVDCSLNITLKGTTVSVSVGGQAAGGYAYNAFLADGSFGLVTAMDGASFDNVTVKTDDPAFLGGNLIAAQEPRSAAETVGILEAAALTRVFEEAKHRWTAIGLAEDIAKLLKEVSFAIDDLGGLTLGRTAGTMVKIDDNAAGWGWFVDSTPAEDTEFVLDKPDAVATHIDLLTVVMHELGHVLGYADGDRLAIMAGTLEPGIRLTPNQRIQAQATSQSPLASSVLDPKSSQEVSGEIDQYVFTLSLGPFQAECGLSLLSVLCSPTNPHALEALEDSSGLLTTSRPMRKAGVFLLRSRRNRRPGYHWLNS